MSQPKSSDMMSWPKPKVERSGLDQRSRLVVADRRSSWVSLDQKLRGLGLGRRLGEVGLGRWPRWLSLGWRSR